MYTFILASCRMLLLLLIHIYIYTCINFFFLFILQTVQHGFPNKPTALAWDPSLRLMIIGTASGAIKVYPFIFCFVTHIYFSFFHFFFYSFLASPFCRRRPDVPFISLVRIYYLYIYLYYSRYFVVRKNQTCVILNIESCFSNYSS